jgi:putative DNA primase/helicase
MDFQLSDRDNTLGFIVEYPGLLSGLDIPEGFFRSDPQSNVWGAIRELAEAGQTVSFATIAERARGNGALGYLTAITGGLYPIKPEEFRSRVFKQAAEDVKKLIIAQIEREAKSGAFDYDSIVALVEKARQLELEAESLTGERTGPSFVSRKAHGIQTRQVTWLWPGVVPVGMPTALEGNPGDGKTFVAVDICARLTRGLGFPLYGEQGHAGPVSGSVIYISSEGVPDRILVPRLIAAGADLERVEIIEGITDKRGEFEILDVNQHLPALALRMKSEPDIKLLVIDPLASHLSPKINMNSSLEMRQAMDCIARFAEDATCAVLVIMHLNKDDRKLAIHRAAGSGQIMAAVKSAWAVLKKPDDENDNRRYFSPVKSNLSPFRRSLAFEIQGVPVHFDDGSEGEIGRVVWSLEPEELDVQAAISPGSFELKSKIGAAVTFLRAELASGPRLARDLFREAEAQKISQDNLWKAKRKEGIEDGREGFQGHSRWFYRNQTKDKDQ